MKDRAERDRMPYIQIDVDRWIVMRNPKDHPVAFIERIDDLNDYRKFLVRRWDLVPLRRVLLGMYDTLEEANRSVKWVNPPPTVPGPPPETPSNQRLR